MSQHISLLTLTVVASGAVTSHRFVGYDGAQAGAGGAALGVSRTNADDGDEVPVDTVGTAIIESGAAISVGDSLESDADGRAVPDTAASNPQAARALESASAVGEPVEVLLLQA